MKGIIEGEKRLRTVDLQKTAELVLRKTQAVVHGRTEELNWCEELKRH